MTSESELPEAQAPFEASFQPVVGIYFLTAACALVINIAMRNLSLPALAEIGIGLLPLGLLFWLGTAYMKFLARADELQQLVHTRAAALTALALLGYLILLNAALPDGRIGPEDMNPVWMTMWMAYLFALKAMRKKYE